MRRRLALAGLLGAAVLGSGAGLAYANSASTDVVETGFATVAEGAVADCPDRSGNTTGDATPDSTGDATGGL